jgi:GT2 family glycosyltransferase
MLTHCISTYNNLPYLKLAVESVRKNSYFKDAPFIIHAENCTDGTYQWLADNGVKYNLTVYIKDLEPSGLGQGMNFIASKVTTQYINFLHSDFYVTENWDLELLKVHEREPAKKLWVNSFRIEPNMFNSPTRHGTLLVDPSDFGAYANDFNKERLEEYAKEFTLLNDFEIPKGEGVSGLVKKYVWDEVGGNDPLFAPTSWDDMDLFLRMKQAGVEFVMPSKSVVWHFGARGSHRLEENGGQSSERQKRAEAENIQKFYSKWKGLPTFDAYGMVNGIK